MDSNLLKRALDIADDALELSGGERAQFLGEACGDDEALRSEVECLLEHAGDIRIAEQSNTVEMPPLPPVSDRFRIRDELSRGGMGVVYFAYDTQLDREVAVKILQERFLQNASICQRFLHEAKVCGKMQHPGTPPVYAFGSLNDGRPFIAMKLVRGETLSSILERPREEATQAWLLTIFKRICETIAYAHSLGIIHRDLKPDNVMVSQFGDVQVMDWGLAKTLSEDASDEQAEGNGLSESRLDTQHIPSRSGGSGLTTRAGIVMGTPAYMPPEQMRGERAPTIDVFQLGAILCEILTGRPPYHSESPIDVYSMAREGELKDALDRLDCAEADPELIEIARKCLEISPEKRLADAGELVREVVDYSNSVRTRLRDVELATARTETRIAEARKRRRIVAGLSTLVAAALIASLAGLSWAMILRAKNAEDAAAHSKQLAADAAEIASQTEELARFERVENRRRNQIEGGFDTVLLEATRLFERAKASPLEHREAWDDARAAIARAEDFVNVNPEIQSLKPRVDELKDTFQSTEVELRIALDVTQARDATFEDPDFVPWGDTRPRINKLDRVVSDNGFHPDSHAEEPIIVDRIRSLPWAISEQLIGAMDEWYLTADDSHRETFTKILDESDPDPLRRQWRTAFTRGDGAALKQVFTNPVTKQLPSRTLVNLVRSLETHLDANTRIDFLQRYQTIHYKDAWYNYLLADLLQANNRVAESIPYYQAFLLARPNHRTRVFLAYALLRQQSFAEAVPYLQQAVRERPEMLAYRTLLIFALIHAGRFEEAVAICDASLKIDPENSYARLALGAVMLELGQLVESIHQLKSLPENVPSDLSWQAAVLLAEALRKNGQSQEALRVFETIDFDKNSLLVGRLAETLHEFAEEALRFSNQDTDQSTHWRERAWQWLQICLGVQDFDPVGWNTAPTLVAMRQTDVLAQLPDVERREWEELWNRADTIASVSHPESDSTWTPIVPSETSTYSGADLVPQDDSSFFVQGTELSRDVYTLTFREDTISAIRLELIPDERLPNSGPGRDTSGAFELGEFALDFVSNDRLGLASQIAFSRTITDRSDAESAVERCIDGNLQTAWRSDREPATSQSVIFVLEQPLALNDGDHLRLHLRHGGIGGTCIGRFRVSLSKEPFATRLVLPTLVSAK